FLRPIGGGVREHGAGDAVCESGGDDSSRNCGAVGECGESGGGGDDASAGGWELECGDAERPGGGGGESWGADGDSGAGAAIHGERDGEYEPRGDVVGERGGGRVRDGGDGGQHGIVHNAGSS